MTLAVSLAIIVTVALYNWSVSPQTNYLCAAQQYTKVADDAARKVTVLEKTIQRKQTELVTAKTELDRNKGRLFNFEQAENFLSGIQPLASELGCVIDSLTFSPAEYIKDDKAIATINIVERTADVRLTGQYAGISEFISRLTDNDRKVVVSDVDLRVTSDFSALNCDMNITVYLMEDKEIDINVD